MKKERKPREAQGNCGNPTEHKPHDFWLNARVGYCHCSGKAWKGGGD